MNTTQHSANDPTDPPPATPPPPPARKHTAGHWVGAGLAGLAVFGVGVWSLNAGSADSTAKPTGVDAYVQCQLFAEDQLVAPGSAQWPAGGGYVAKDHGSGVWRVDTYVDSQNSFGALVRSQVTCVMSVSGDTWTPEQITIK